MVLYICSREGVTAGLCNPLGYCASPTFTGSCPCPKFLPSATLPFAFSSSSCASRLHSTFLSIVPPIFRAAHEFQLDNSLHFIVLPAFLWCTGEDEGFCILLGEIHPRERNIKWTDLLLNFSLLILFFLLLQWNSLSHKQLFMHSNFPELTAELLV